MPNKTYNKVKRHSKLLKDKKYKDLIEKMLQSYTIDKIVPTKNSVVVFLKDNTLDLITLTLSQEKVTLEKESPNELSIKTISEDLYTEQLYEYTKESLVVTKTTRKYEQPINTKEKHITALDSKRYVIPMETILKRYTEANYVVSVGEIYKLLTKDPDVSLSSMAALETVVQTQVNLNGESQNKNEILETPAKVVVNDKDVTALYKNVTGVDVLNRIYDLYRGTITAENLRDLALIKFGAMPMEAFDLKRNLGITRQEEQLTPSISQAVDYKKSLPLLQTMFVVDERSTLQNSEQLFSSIQSLKAEEQSSSSHR